MMQQENIDIVITWVDGDDPAHKNKKNLHLTGKNETSHDDIAGATRYRSTGEIFYCVASILRYAPWVHKIYIVTDNQDPHVDEFVARNFPENKTPIEIVDHTVIFRGYEQYLPTFNSLSIGPDCRRIFSISMTIFFLFRKINKPIGSTTNKPYCMPISSMYNGRLSYVGPNTCSKIIRPLAIKTLC